MELKYRQVITSNWKNRNWLQKILYLPRIPVLGLIILYRTVLSPDHSWLKGLFPNGYCRFNPSCSTYGFEAIDKYGLIKGGFLAFWRILRCNPFNPGGDDYLK